MEEIKIVLENGQDKLVDGIFYIYNAKYYFMYTEKELDENGYVIMHIVQVGKEAVNTQDGGTSSTGNMVGVEISNDDEWKQVQTSITKIVEDKKNGTVSPEIQYLTKDMLVNLKIVSKKTFRLMKDVVVNVFKVNMDTPAVAPAPVEAPAEVTAPALEPTPVEAPAEVAAPALEPTPVETPAEVAAPTLSVEPTNAPVQIEGAAPVSIEQDLTSVSVGAAAPTPAEAAPVQTTVDQVQLPTDAPASVEVTAPTIEPAPVEAPALSVEPTVGPMGMEPEAPVSPVQPFGGESTPVSNEEFLEDSNVIIDYRAKFFEEQEKNKELQKQLDELNEKINSIKGIIA